MPVDVRKINTVHSIVIKYLADMSIDPLEKETAAALALILIQCSYKSNNDPLQILLEAMTNLNAPDNVKIVAVHKVREKM